MVEAGAEQILVSQSLNRDITEEDTQEDCAAEQLGQLC